MKQSQTIRAGPAPANRWGAAPARRGRIRTEIKHALTGRQPLPRRSHQQLELDIIVGRADVPGIARPPVGGVHDLNRSGA
jgi:hypothetical protein